MSFAVWVLAGVLLTVEQDPARAKALIAEADRLAAQAKKLREKGEV